MPAIRETSLFDKSVDGRRQGRQQDSGELILFLREEHKSVFRLPHAYSCRSEQKADLFVGEWTSWITGTKQEENILATIFLAPIARKLAYRSDNSAG